MNGREVKREKNIIIKKRKTAQVAPRVVLFMKNNIEFYC